MILTTIEGKVKGLSNVISYEQARQPNKQEGGKRWMSHYGGGNWTHIWKATQIMGNIRAVNRTHTTIFNSGSPGHMSLVVYWFIHTSQNRSSLKRWSTGYACGKTVVRLPTIYEMPGTVVHASNPSANAIRRRLKTGKSPEACEPDSLRCTAADTKNTISNKVEGKGWHLTLSSDLQTHHNIHITHI